jgi:acyl-coenzyme A synthetase/AMP-(fatty) acid ligase
MVLSNLVSLTSGATLVIPAPIFDPEATADAIDPQGWLHSGDLGVMEADGTIKITGRLKEMVIRGDESLFPREVEEFLRGFSIVYDVYVVGVPDKKYGEDDQEVIGWSGSPVSTGSRSGIPLSCQNRGNNPPSPGYP